MKKPARIASTGQGMPASISRRRLRWAAGAAVDPLESALSHGPKPPNPDFHPIPAAPHEC
ncbi:MAG: hypothetical protein NTW21_22820 [Verrucomicrobia bacterium]|nr:hypothetical protein [Verrucomicrobiota bacterium]